jgi:curli biogenesis system outer membrane secretion channel CsgG
MKSVISLSFLCALALAADPALAAPKAGAAPETRAPQLKRAVVVEDFLGSEAMGAAATSLTAILEDDLVKDGRFVVIARPSAQTQAAQAAAAATAAATPGTPDADKAALAALTQSLIVRGTITKFEANAKGSGFTIGGLPMGRMAGGGAAGVTGSRAIVELTLQLVDGSTGQVLGSGHGSGSAGQHQLTAGATSSSGATVGGTSQKATPVQQAADEAIRKAIEGLAHATDRLPWSALVVDAEDGAIYINAGSDANVTPGLTMSVWHKRKVLTDPVSGAVIDVLMDRIGTVAVTEVRDRTSTAKKVDGADPQKGDLVKVP